MLIHWIIFGFVLLLGNPGGIANAQDDSTAALLGASVVLTCPIDVTSCGELHSVRWFRGSERIAAVSGDGNVANVDSKYSQRMNIQHSSSGPSTRLEIKSTKIEDEGIYKCDITFLHPLDTCFASGGYRIDLKIHVKPSEIHVFDEHGKNIENGKVLGPVREKHKLQATCEAKGARPAPTVTWLQNGKQLGVEFAKPTIDEALGLFTVKSELSVVLQRQHLGADFECRVETPALTDPVSNHLQLDLQVGPTTVELSGVEDHAVQGANVLLKCKVEGARPAANVTWYNGTQEISADVKDVTEIEAESHQQKDGTFVTISKLLFVATRFDNEKIFKCEAENLVTKELGLKPVFEILDLQVMYPPVVTVRPENHTANEYESVLLFCDYHANPGTLKAVVWLKDGQPVDVSSSRYDGGELEHTALVINNVSRSDIGVYACNLTNMINSSLSENEINLDVHFPPTVQLQMDPDGPVIENMEANVTLYCNIIEGNPPTLLKVRWILEGNLLKELPDCKPNSSPDGEDLCNIDPSKLLLQNIGREFLGNYSCEGYNAAGWGPRSPENDLIVYYEPGNATLVHYPLIPLKNENVSFTCSIEDPGYPPATKFRWLRGGAVVKGHNDSVYNVTAVGLKDRTNFSCLAYNDGGDGNMAVVDLEVHVPPFFITKMKPYSGALYSDKNASLTCRVECVPECSIVWFKNSVGIEKNSDKYYFVEEYMKAVPATGDFESISSTLHFNMSAWPNQEFDIKEDNSNYSCSSTDNPVGPGVRSVTYFSIEYPPENANISDKFINVTEGDVPPRVLCSANGNPEPVYKWVYNYDVISNDSALIINEKMSRDDSGQFTCVAYNKHGTTSIKTFINVLYKPSCEVVRKEIKDEDTLTCTGKGNPDDLHYTWSIKNENDSAKMLNVRPKGQQSRLILDDDFSVTRTYVCIANNELGVGTPCEIEVAGRLPWYQRWDKTTIIILVVAIITVILSALALCIIIICICRRKRRQDKLNGKSSTLADPLTEPGEYENLPFHGLQTAPNKPLSPQDLIDDLDYADVDYRSYGPINYKAASIYALVKKDKKDGKLKEVNPEKEK